MAEPPRAPEADPPLEDWIGDARRGSPEALGRALEACRADLLAAAARGLPADLRSRACPADLVQETFAKAHRDFGRFAGRTGPEWRGWLRGILRNDLRLFARGHRAARKRGVGREAAPPPAEASGRGAGREAADPGTTPADAAIARERADAVGLALGRLGRRHRAAVVLRFGRGRTFRQIAARLGGSPAGARKSLARALALLRLDLGPDWDPGPGRAGSAPGRGAPADAPGPPRGRRGGGAAPGTEPAGRPRGAGAAAAGAGYPAPATPAR